MGVGGERVVLFVSGVDLNRKSDPQILCLVRSCYRTISSIQSRSMLLCKARSMCSRDSRQNTNTNDPSL